MPKVSEAHREARRDQILDAAVACFLRRGVRATTMAEIIAESGLSAGAIYGYFDGKQELALAAVRREAAGRAADLEAAAGERAIPPSRMLRIITEALGQRTSGLALVVQMWGEAASDPEFQQVSASAFAELGAMFAAHLARWMEQEGDLEPDAAEDAAQRLLPVMLGLVQGLILQQTLVPEFDRERYLTGVDLILRPTSGVGVQGLSMGA